MIEPKLATTKSVAQLMLLVVIGFLVFAGIAGATFLLLVAAAILVAACLYFRDSIEAALRWQRPEIVLPAPGLALGSEIDLIYRRKSRRVRDVPSCSLSCVLICEERAEYRQGTSTHTDTSDVFRGSFTGSGEGTIDGLTGNVEIAIPAHVGAPTVDLGHNEVRWQLETQVRGRGVPKDTHIFDIRVVPTLALPEWSGPTDTEVQDS